MRLCSFRGPDGPVPGLVEGDVVVPLAVAAEPGGPPLLVATSRAIRKSTKGTGRRLGGPIESASGLE
ncbi:MAG: hypothetical protein ACKOGE_08825, partial [Actinomycetota bacterium]